MATPARLFLCIFLSATLLAEDELSLERIVVIGASVSRGFTEKEPFGGEKSNLLRLDQYLDAALLAPHGKIINDANQLFFTNPEKEANTQLKRLEQRKPTLVVGIDFLFWFLYGYPEKTGDRLALFNHGLDLLSQVNAPLIIGDVPDCSAAIGHMLARSMVPDAEIRNAANRRLATWASGRTNVTIVPLSQFVASAESNNAIKAGLLTLPKDSTRDLLQADRLHPTRRGCAALALAIIAKFPPKTLDHDQVVWDVEKISAISTVD